MDETWGERWNGASLIFYPRFNVRNGATCGALWSAWKLRAPTGEIFITLVCCEQISSTVGCPTFPEINVCSFTVLCPVKLGLTVLEALHVRAIFFRAEC